MGFLLKRKSSLFQSVLESAWSFYLKLQKFCLKLLKDIQCLAIKQFLYHRCVYHVIYEDLTINYCLNHKTNGCLLEICEETWNDPDQIEQTLHVYQKAYKISKNRNHNPN